MPLLTAYVASSSLVVFLLGRSCTMKKSLRLLVKWPILILWRSLRPLPPLLLTKRLLLQWAIPHMMPFFLALEAHNVGRILHLSLALLLVALVLQRDSVLALGVGVESKPTLVTWGASHTQHILERGLPFMTPFQVILQRSDLSLELFDFLYMVNINNNTRGSRSFIVRATRQMMQFITRFSMVVRG